MASLVDIIGYICHQYPHKDELSKARLTKMVYLADWKSAIEHGHQLSKIEWKFNHYGPYVDDVWIAAYEDEHFNVDSTTNLHGGLKEVISLKKPFDFSSLTDSDRTIIDHVISQTQSLYWEPFLKLVYSTFPVLVSSRYDTLNLEQLAERYKKEFVAV